MIEIEAPDGSIVEFPDGTPDAVISGAMAKAFGGPQQGALPLSSVGNVEPLPDRSMWQNIGGGFKQGLLDVGGALTRGLDYGAERALGFSPHERIFGQSVQEKAQNLGANFDQNYGDSWAATGGRIGGQLAGTLPITAGGGMALQAAGRAVPTIAPATQFLSGAGGLGSRMANSAILGGTAATLAEGATSDNLGRDMAFGAAIGAAVPGVGAAGRAIGRKTADALTGGATRRAQTQIAKEFTKAAPDTEALRRMGSEAFKKAEAAGVVVRPDAMRGQVDDIARWASKEGIDPTLHPGATAALKRLVDVADEPLSLEKIQTLRRVVGSAAKSQSPDERRLAYGMIERIDDFVAGLTPEKIQSGNLGTAADDLVNARNLWARMKKSELIDTAIEKASRQASGVENGIRIQFRQILNNPRLRKSFNKDELKLLDDVVKGDFSTNTLRRLGKLSAGSGAQSNVLNSMMGTGLGAGFGGAVGGPIGAAVGAGAVQGLGYGSQRGAQALTTKKAQLARALMASGATSAPVEMNPQLSRLAAQLASGGRQNIPGYVAPAAALTFNEAFR
jgi:hypothetical protein